MSFMSTILVRVRLLVRKYKVAHNVFPCTAHPALR